MRTLQLVDSIKEELRKRGITYKDLAKQLGLSEAAVKRQFAMRNFSMKRLDEICDVLQVDLRDLLRASEPRAADEWPLEVEEALAREPELIITLYQLLFTPLQSLAKSLGISQAELHKLYRRLESLGLIEVHTENKIKVKFNHSIRWRTDGPLAKRFGLGIREEFFNCDFKGKHQAQDFLTRSLSPESWKIFHRKMRALFQTLEELSEVDRSLPDHYKEVFWVYAGIRQWAPLEAMKRLLPQQKH